MSAARSAAVNDADASSADLRAAFRELHGRRLHGFALLLTLGDRSLAGRLTAEALASGADRVEELRHPERAAAWLRARVVDHLPRRHEPPSPDEERAALDPLGVDRIVVDGLDALTPHERAALVAADVERLDRGDVESVVGRRGAALDRLLTRARTRYLSAVGRSPIAPDRDIEAGLLVRRIRAVAARAMG